MLSLIVAAATNGVIGVRNTLPWHLPDDLKRFKALTLGKTVIMGRKTFESIGRPLPQRRNLVITRQDLTWPGVEVVNSLEAALTAAGADTTEEVFVIGGADIYRQALPLAQRVYLTRVDALVDGDAFFPELDRHWREVPLELHATDEHHAQTFSFLIMERSL